MKFGIYSSIANPPRGEHLDRCIDEVIAEAQLAEECGFDACFFGEHHQDKDGFLPSPLIVATAVAAQTRRLNVGTSVILLPLHHPVHLAEEVITLDLVSKGRVILGVGIGYQAADFQAFAVPMEHRAGTVRRGRRDHPQVLERRDLHVSRLALPSGQHTHPPPAVSIAGSAAVDWGQCSQRRPPGRTARRRLCGHPERRLGEHTAPDQHLPTSRPWGWTSAPGGAHAGRLGGQDPR